MTHPKLEGFPVVVEADLAWGEMDAFGHLNNVLFFRYFENARIRYMDEIGWFELHRTAGIGPIVASTQCRFRRPVHYPDRLLIGARIITIEPDRATFEHRMISRRWDDLAAEGQAVIVNYDYAAAQKAMLTHELRSAIDRLEAGRTS